MKQMKSIVSFRSSIYFNPLKFNKSHFKILVVSFILDVFRSVNIIFPNTWYAIDMKDRVLVRYISNQKSLSGIVEILDVI